MRFRLWSGDEDAEVIGISNWFLRRIEDKDTHGTVVCGKTGFTNEAGNCAVSYQESDDGGHYICVTAQAPGGWTCIYDHVEFLYETLHGMRTEPDTASPAQWLMEEKMDGNNRFGKNTVIGGALLLASIALAAAGIAISLRTGDTKCLCG